MRLIQLGYIKNQNVFLIILVCFLFSCENKAENKTANEYINEGIRHTGEQKYDKAISSFKKAIKTDPDNALAHYTLGGIYTLKNMNKMAIEEYEKAIELDPAYPDPHYSLGFVYEKIGRKKEADQEYLLFDILKDADKKIGKLN
ncbi:MAG: tetratricopeptide repeat protein [Candidatus Anammoxibacter sp.]